MAIRLFDFECPKHGLFEDFQDAEINRIPCPVCGKVSMKRPSIGRVNVVNEDAPHIRESAQALLDPETAHLSDKPHVRALAKNPTRSNLQRYMKAEGLRYVENEGGGPPRYRKPPDPDMSDVAGEILKKRRKRYVPEVRS
jgi:hypothetical protein